MAAVRFPGSLFAQFVWPIFGAAAVVGIVLSIVCVTPLPLEPQAGYRAVVTGGGVLAAWLLPGIGGLLTGGLLVGGGFLCAVQLSFYSTGASWHPNIPAIWRGY